MGRNVVLALYGKPTFYRGLSNGAPTCAIRLRSLPRSGSSFSSDFALIRSKEELREAAQANSDGAVIVSDDRLENLPEAASFTRLISVPSKFGYFSDGDIIAQE
jgi:hypothetical protein